MAVFYGCRYGLGDRTAALYGVFGVIAFAMLSHATGRPAQRTRTLFACLAFGVLVVTVGTYAAVTNWVAVLTMFVFGFLVSFAGVAGVRVSEVSTGLQLLFILPSLPPFDPASLGSRLFGLVVGMAALIVADRFLLPAAAPPPFTDRLADALEKCAALAEAMTRAGRVGGSVGRAELDTRLAEARVAASGLRLVDVPLGERPSSPLRRDRGLVDAAGALEATFHRLAVLRAELQDDPDELPVPVIAAVGATLASVGAFLRGDGPMPTADPLTQALGTERTAWRQLLARDDPQRVARALRGVGGAATLVAAVQAAESVRAVVLAVRAGSGASVPAEDSGPDDPFWYAHGSVAALVWHRVRRNLTVRSVEFQNAVRLAVGLALARYVAGEFGFSHGLWILLATLTLTRTSVRATRGALKPALIGTLVGVVLAGLLLLVAGQTEWVYVALFPITVFAAVLAGPVVGPIGIQAAFTLVVACLFSQVAPPTLELARDRLVDVLVGAVVGVVVGIAAWPRGGQAEMRRAGARCLASAADCVDATADWIVSTGPPDALGARLDAVRQASALYEATYAQYRSEPADDRDTTDWLVVGVITVRAASGAEAAVRWSDHRGALPWPDVRADLETAARRIADEFRSAAYRLSAPAVHGHHEVASTGSRASLREADRRAVRAGLEETAREPRREQHPSSTLRAIEAWGWLWWLADDLSRLEGETPAVAIAGPSRSKSRPAEPGKT